MTEIRDSLGNALTVLICYNRIQLTKQQTELKNAFHLTHKDKKKIYVVAANQIQDKRDWMKDIRANNINKFCRDADEEMSEIFTEKELKSQQEKITMTSMMVLSSFLLLLHLGGCYVDFGFTITGQIEGHIRYQKTCDFIEPQPANNRKSQDFTQVMQLALFLVVLLPTRALTLH